MSSIKLKPESTGVYHSLNLPVYNPQYSYVGSYEPNRDVLVVHGHGDIQGRDETRLAGKRELSTDGSVQAAQRKWFGLLEALTVRGKVSEMLEPVLPLIRVRDRRSIDSRINAWNKRNELRDTPENRDLLRAACLAGAYAVNHPNIYAVTDAPSKKDDPVKLRISGVGYVANLAGFGVFNREGDPLVHAVVTGMDYNMAVLPHQTVDPYGEHGAILIKQPTEVAPNA